LWLTAGRWLRWFGVGRLLTGALSVVVMCAGAYLLLRSPTPPAEAGLPVAAPDASAATLAPPSTAATTVPATDSATPAVTQIVVHVAGAVQRPGVYELLSTARVDDAVNAAGGVASDGDANSVNLASTLVDGQRIYVPRLGEVDPFDMPSVAAPATQAAPGSTVPAGPIDLNAATAADLESLPGVGPATAAAIIDDRITNGPFASVDDLDRVPGIGPAKLEVLRELVTT
jgi:competence protein ComEA